MTQNSHLQYYHNSAMQDKKKRKEKNKETKGREKNKNKNKEGIENPNK